MTKQQEQKLNAIRNAVTRQWLYNDDSEIKTWEVEENEFFVSLRVEVGLKGDEGTMAAIFGRESALIFIGKKGGLSYPTNAKHNYKIKKNERYQLMGGTLCSKS